MLKYAELKEKPKEFLAATGLTDEEFQCLLPTFEQCYVQLSPKKPKPDKRHTQRAKGGGRKSKFENLSDKLLFILIYQKTIPLSNDARLEFWVEPNAGQLLGSSPVAGFAKEFERDRNETRTRWTESSDSVGSG
jgi:hypothetical protein